MSSNNGDALATTLKKKLKYVQGPSFTSDTVYRKLRRISVVKAAAPR